MAWEVEFSDEFEQWWDGLTGEEQDSIDPVIYLLEERGPALTRPHADTIKGSAYSNMRELRVQHQGRPIRILYAFDPRRSAYLIIGGDKTGNDRWYGEMIPIADTVYRKHIEELKE
jgi:hypothetical protein